MKAKAVIFDLDGTLIDSLEDLADCMNAVLRRLGQPEHSLAQYRIFVGDGVKKLAERCLAESRPDLLDQAVVAMRAEYGQNWMRKTRLYPGIPDLLNQLAQQKIPMAVLSNKPHDMTRLICSHFLASWPVAFVQGAGEKFPHKPDPAGALHIAMQLKCAPSDMLLLGDTDVDMQTAKAAGMTPIGVSWGFRPREELLANGSKHIIDHPVELVDLINCGVLNKTEYVKKQILEAFDGVQLEEGVSISQAKLYDAYINDPLKLAEARRNDNEQSWLDISDEKIRDHDDDFPFLDAKGFRFYLPAYMCYTLNHLNCSDPSVVGEWTLHALNGDSFERFLIFNEKQKKAIQNFLLFLIENNTEDLNGIAIDAAEYWK